MNKIDNFHNYFVGLGFKLRVLDAWDDEGYIPRFKYLRENYYICYEEWLGITGKLFDVGIVDAEGNKIYQINVLRKRAKKYLGKIFRFFKNINSAENLPNSEFIAKIESVGFVLTTNIAEWCNYLKLIIYTRDDFFIFLPTDDQPYYRLSKGNDIVASEDLEVNIRVGHGNAAIFAAINLLSKI